MLTSSVYCLRQDRANRECLASVKNRTAETCQSIPLTKVEPSNEPMRRISADLRSTLNMPNKKASGSEAGKQLSNATCNRDATLSKSPKAKQRSSPNPTQPIDDDGMEPQPAGKSAPTAERASKRNASASSTQLTSKKDQMEDSVTCKVCQRNLSVIEFSKSKLKKLRKAKAKGKHMQMVCKTCTTSNKGNKKACGSEATNQLGNGRDATASTSRPGNDKRTERSPNKFQSQQSSSKAKSSSSQPAAAPRSTHDSAAKTKSRDTVKQPREVTELSHNHHHSQQARQGHLHSRSHAYSDSHN